MKLKPIPAIVKGLLISNGVAFIILLLTAWIGNRNDGAGVVFIMSDFIVVPILMGLSSAYCWKNLKLSIAKTIGWSAINMVIGILLAAIFMGEGVICLIIVSPLVLLFLLVGAFVGKYLFKARNTTLNASVLAVLFLIIVADGLTVHGNTKMVSDQMIIHASPAQVWQHVVAFKPIEQKPDFWLFQLGMPQPMETTVEGYYEGAGRACIFNNGIVFEEKIAVFDPARNLTFDIVKQPQDPELMGHIRIDRGQFLLQDNGDGTTTLIGNSWYTLYVHPDWYYDLWANSITRNVHLRVMEHIKALSETGA
jgi:hypothetical protein